MVVWRNKVKHCLDFFIQRFLYPLKELGIEGRRYTVFLENFADPTVTSRTFSFTSESSGFGDIVGVRANLFRAVETIDKDVDTCQRILLTARDKSMEHPSRRQRVPQLVKSAESLRDLDESLAWLATTTEVELAEEDKVRELQRAKAKMLTTVPLTNFVRYKWLLLPIEYGKQKT